MVKLFVKRFLLTAILFVGASVGVFYSYLLVCEPMSACSPRCELPNWVLLMLLPLVLLVASAWVAEKMIQAPKPAVSEAGKLQDSVSE